MMSFLSKIGFVKNTAIATFGGKAIVKYNTDSEAYVKRNRFIRFFIALFARRLYIEKL